MPISKARLDSHANYINLYSCGKRHFFPLPCSEKDSDANNIIASGSNEEDQLIERKHADLSMEFSNEALVSPKPWGKSRKRGSSQKRKVVHDEHEDKEGDRDAEEVKKIKIALEELEVVPRKPRFKKRSAEEEEELLTTMLGHCLQEEDRHGFAVAAAMHEEVASGTIPWGFYPSDIHKTN